MTKKIGRNSLGMNVYELDKPITVQGVTSKYIVISYSGWLNETVVFFADENGDPFRKSPDVVGRRGRYSDEEMLALLEELHG